MGEGSRHICFSAKERQLVQVPHLRALRGCVLLVLLLVYSYKVGGVSGNPLRYLTMVSSAHSWISQELTTAGRLFIKNNKQQRTKYRALRDSTTNWL